MPHSARTLAAAILVAALVIPATLQASGLPGSGPAARDDGGLSLRAESWTFGSFGRFVQQLWPKCGILIDPSGGCGGSIVSPPANPTLQPRPKCGPGIDPSGGCGGSIVAPPAHPTANRVGGVDPNGGRAATQRPIHPRLSPRQPGS